MAEPASIPRATYRIQFRNGFGFADAERIVPYLADLGISHLYASPIFKARKGSAHGYDAVDFNEIDPVLGGDEAFDALIAALGDRGMGLILDFVPNHMGIGADNAWWWDVLAKGQTSAFAAFFDIDWAAGDGKLVLPFLGAPLEEVLAAGELSIDTDPGSGSPVLRYYEHRWPIAPDGSEDLAGVSDDKTALAALIDRQAYRLIHWQRGPKELNYRRFFEVDDLVALRMDRDEVFETSHRLLLRLIGERKVQGVRLDHIDGLLDPLGYCRRLADAAATALGEPSPSLEDMRAGRPIYLLVEKILGHGEQLPSDLMAAGTTGYEFMTALAGLMVDPAAETSFAETKAVFGGEDRPFATIAAEAKIEVLTSSFEGELERLSAALHALAKKHADSAACTPDACREALVAVIAAFPVYRSYVSERGADDADRLWIKKALDGAALTPPLSRLLADLLLGAAPSGSGISRDDALGFAMRLQQLTGPVMAKAVEDRAFYRDVRLVSLNDVGGEPAVFGATIGDFHHWVEQRETRQRTGMLATATHDHKRGEDVRARLHVLSEIPDAWRRSALGWQTLNAGLIEPIDGRPAPSADDEYLIYQTLLGVWPPGLDPADQDGLDQLQDRLITYMQKASREAAVRTRWTDPDQGYEAATARFVRALLNAKTSTAFLHEVLDLVDRLAVPGMINGLVQTVLKLTLPGIPDIYQGTEVWDRSLVDPDNRRPVDFSSLAGRLREEIAFEDLLADHVDGRIKQAVIGALLQLRRAEPALFASGDYLPVTVAGADAEHVLAFARIHERRALLVVVPRLTARRLVHHPGASKLALDWADTRLLLPEPLRSSRLTDALAKTAIGIDGQTEVSIASIIGALPLAVLISGG